MKMRLLYILYCPPTPATWRQGPFNPFAILHMPIYQSPSPHPAFLLAGALARKDLLIPSPFYICRFTGPPPPILPSYWLAHWPITQSRFWPPRGEGGDRYNTTTCRMAEDTKGPCISHVDVSHGEWPRIESSLLFCNFFYIVKIIEKSLFSEGEIGFTR